MGRGLFDGFDGYRTPTDADYDRVLASGLVVLDTNVLHNLYRYSSQARKDLFSVLEAFGDRLWIPHQVAAEFWRGREGVLGGATDETNKAISEITELASKATNEFGKWANRVSLEENLAQDLGDKVQAAFAVLIDNMKAAIKPDSDHSSLDTNSDRILARLVGVVAGKLGDPPAQDERDLLIRVARERVANSIPPGYMDKSKEGDGPAGDYLIWEQTMREAKKRSADVLLVTGERKPDWWRIIHGKLRGPRTELIDEIRREANVRLFLMLPESLLWHAKRAFDIDVQDSSVEDVERVDKVAHLTGETWPAEAIAEDLLARLPDVQISKYSLTLLLQYIAFLGNRGFLVTRADLPPRNDFLAFVVERADRRYVIIAADETDTLGWPDAAAFPDSVVVALFGSDKGESGAGFAEQVSEFAIVWRLANGWRGNKVARDQGLVDV